MILAFESFFIKELAANARILFFYRINFAALIFLNLRFAVPGFYFKFQITIHSADLIYFLHPAEEH